MSGSNSFADEIPTPLRARAKVVVDSNNSLEITYHALVLLQQAILYLASLAFAEYRGLAEKPDLEAELELASYVARSPTFSNYRTLLRRCVAATGKASKLYPLYNVTVPASRKLNVLRDVSSKRLRRVGKEYHERIQNLDSPPPKFEAYLEILSNFRNQAFAHTDWHALDGAEDFFTEAAPVLKQVANEFLTCPEVTDAWTNLCLAKVHDIKYNKGQPDEYVVMTNDKDARAVVRVDRSGARKPFVSSQAISQGDEVLLVQGDPDELVHSYWDLADGGRPEPEIESIVNERLLTGHPDEALAALRSFAGIAQRNKQHNKRLLRQWLPTPLVDDVVISALQHFKLNGDTIDKNIPLNARILLELVTTELPERIVRVADRFAEVTVRHPSAPPQGRRRVDTLARGSSHTSRLEAAIKLGFQDDENARERLEDMARNDLSRKVRMQALLSLGHGPGRIASAEVSPVLMGFANQHRDDPETACCALIALGALRDLSCVDFIAEYVLSDAPFACLDAAAWGLAALADEEPTSIDPWNVKLYEFATDSDNDPYTRGTVLYCLSKLGDLNLAYKIAALIIEGEDPFVIEDACAALASIGDPRSVETLAGVLNAVDGALGDLCVKREAIRSLGVIGSEQAAAALEAYTPPDGLRFIERVLTEALSNCIRSDTNQPGEPQPVRA